MDLLVLNWLFHNHDRGTDDHTALSLKTIARFVDRLLGIPHVYAGIHYDDPGFPNRDRDTEGYLTRLLGDGIEPGVEFNIVKLGDEWRLDVTREELIRLKKRFPGFMAIASIHAVAAYGFEKESDGEVSPEQHADVMLEAYLQVMDHYKELIDVIGHPFLYVDYEVSNVTPKHIEQLARKAFEFDIALELNIAQIGLKFLLKDWFEASLQEVTNWAPVLRFPKALESIPVKIAIGGDFHGLSPIERMIASEKPTREAFFTLPKYQNAVGLMNAVLEYFQVHGICGERVPNTWNEEKLIGWLNRWKESTVQY